VRLLPLFDPYLMGYAKRDHLVDRAFATRVSRTAGWISAVVLVDGRAAGTWTHVLSNQTLRITVDPFRKLPAPVVSGIRERAAELAKSMGATKTEVRVA
jgi:Winged helix DNA-binding domain